MKINKIKINSYGKLKNKEINLENNLNIIYGKNESGKSTILNFILNILYGISKNKKGKEISDYEKYKPWDTENFSGKLIYELDDKNKYEIYREFNKKNPNIFDENKEEIKNRFNIDKKSGNEFFYEQTQISEEMFLSTSIAIQQQVKIGKDIQNNMIQKISNLLGTGEDSISYKKAIEKLNKKQLEEIGTERSKEKPINITKKQIEELTSEINELKKYENLKYEIEEKINKLKNELNQKQNENILIKKIKEIKNKNDLEKEKIKIKEKIIEENNQKIKKIKNNINIENEKYLEEKNNNEKYKNIKTKKNKLKSKLNIILIILILINSIWIIFIPKINSNKILKYIFLITIPVYLICYILNINKITKKINKIENNQKIEIDKIKAEINKLENEQKIIEKNTEELKKEIEKENIKNNFLINLEKEKIIKEYYNKRKNNIEINKLFDFENSNNFSELIENEIYNLKIEINKLEIQKENIENQLENLSNLEEELEVQKNKFLDLEKQNNSIELARKLLEKAYEKMKNTISPKFTDNLSSNISKITNGKYKNIYFNDENGLTIELENGNYVPAERLSVGTIDQLYLSLRLAMLDEISEEKVPIMLDETFAYFDNERLKNILIYLSTEYKNRQIIIFTCTKREIEILEKLKISYNLIKL